MGVLISLLAFAGAGETTRALPAGVAMLRPVTGSAPSIEEIHRSRLRP